MADSKNITLDRSLGLKLAVVIVVGNIIGSGIFKKIAPMAAEVNSAPLVLLCWVLGGIITLFGALSTAEIAGMYADTGGEFVYFKKIYNNFFAFLYGWASFSTIRTASAASLAYVFAQSVHSAAPLPEILPHLTSFNIAGLFYPFAGFNVKLLAITLILLLTWFNSLGIKLGLQLSTVLLILIGLSLIIITFFGFVSSVSTPAEVLKVGSNAKTVGIGAMFSAMLAAFWAYEGWNSVGFIAGEIKNPNRNVPVSFFLGVVGVIIIYLLVNAAYLSVLSTDKLTEIHHSENQIAAVEVMRTIGGNGGALAISLLIIVSTLGCLHATVLSCSRIYYAMAADGLFFRQIKSLNKARVPAKSLWLQGIWAAVLLLSGNFDQLTDTLIFVAFIFYGATAAGVFLLRKREPNAHRPYRVWGYPIIPAIFIAFCLILTINTIIAKPREAIMGLFLMAIGVPFYFIFKKTSKKF